MVFNYVDTTYPYHNGQSELLVYRALRDGYREKVFLATKSLAWALESAEDFDRILAEQLERLETDHIDYYLLYALDRNTFENKVLVLILLAKFSRPNARAWCVELDFPFTMNMRCSSVLWTLAANGIPVRFS